MDFAEFQRDREFLPHDHTRVQEFQHMSENEQNARSQLIWAAGQIKWPHEMFLTVLCIAELCGCLMLLAVLCTPVCVLCYLMCCVWNGSDSTHYSHLSSLYLDIQAGKCWTVTLDILLLV